MLLGGVRHVEVLATKSELEPLGDQIGNNEYDEREKHNGSKHASFSLQQLDSGSRVLPRAI
jgi:hypothetical protein